MLVFKLIEDKSLLFLSKRSFRTWSSRRATAKPKTASKPAEVVKDAKPASAAAPAGQAPKGIPYNKLTIGIPKEVWPNERR